MRYELHLEDGRVAEWEGRDHLDAARSLIEAEKAEGVLVAVIGWRLIDHHNLFPEGHTP